MRIHFHAHPLACVFQLRSNDIFLQRRKSSVLAEVYFFDRLVAGDENAFEDGVEGAVDVMRVSGENPLFDHFGGLLGKVQQDLAINYVLFNVVYFTVDLVYLLFDDNDLFMRFSRSI